ncbi:AAA family ATPase [Rathayibacter sp. CAU 1779]
MDPAVIEALQRAVAAAPNETVLRIHLAECLLAASRYAEALAQVSTVLEAEPGNADARAIAIRTANSVTESLRTGDRRALADTEQAMSAPTEALVPQASELPEPGHEEQMPVGPPVYDWSAAETELAGLVPPMFVDPSDATARTEGSRDRVTMADVAGMADVKKRVEAAFLAPLRNPKLRSLYAKSLRGGLLLYGPPGCGKTFIGRAIAGELGAQFLSVSPTDILDGMLGASERNMHLVFEYARSHSPCVVFFDEVDALGRRRSSSHNDGIRGTIDQLLTELDGVGSDNDGVFVLAATNQPWDVDPALRRPGRFDRTMLVLPPDRVAREALFRAALETRPIELVDVPKLAAATGGLSGADIGYVCDIATEQALLESVETGSVRMVSMAHLEAAIAEVQSSVGPWLDTARTMVTFGSDDGTYAELRAYLKKARRG